MAAINACQPVSSLVSPGYTIDDDSIDSDEPLVSPSRLKIKTSPMRRRLSPLQKRETSSLRSSLSAFLDTRLVPGLRVALTSATRSSSPQVSHKSVGSMNPSLVSAVLTADRGVTHLVCSFNGRPQLTLAAEEIAEIVTDEGLSEAYGVQDPDVLRRSLGLTSQRLERDLVIICETGRDKSHLLALLSLYILVPTNTNLQEILSQSNTSKETPEHGADGEAGQGEERRGGEGEGLKGEGVKGEDKETRLLKNESNWQPPQSTRNQRQLTSTETSPLGRFASEAPPKEPRRASLRGDASPRREPLRRRGDSSPKTQRPPALMQSTSLQSPVVRVTQPRRREETIRTSPQALGRSGYLVVERKLQVVPVGSSPFGSAWSALTCCCTPLATREEFGIEAPPVLDPSPLSTEPNYVPSPTPFHMSRTDTPPTDTPRTNLQSQQSAPPPPAAPTDAPASMARASTPEATSLPSVDGRMISPAGEKTADDSSSESLSPVHIPAPASFRTTSTHWESPADAPRLDAPKLDRAVSAGGEGGGAIQTNAAVDDVDGMEMDDDDSWEGGRRLNQLETISEESDGQVEPRDRRSPRRDLQPSIRRQQSVETGGFTDNFARPLSESTWQPAVSDRENTLTLLYGKQLDVSPGRHIEAARESPPVKTHGGDTPRGLVSPSVSETGLSISASQVVPPSVSPEGDLNSPLRESAMWRSQVATMSPMEKLASAKMQPTPFLLASQQRLLSDGSTNIAMSNWKRSAT